MKLSICIPIYKGSEVLKEALLSILKQDFKDYEIIIGGDNNPSDLEEIKKTKKILDDLNDERIKYFGNEKNLGYALNLKRVVEKAKGEILFLFAQDDILAKDALQKTHDAFLNSEVGVVTRPYFWYEDDIKKPVRYVAPLNKEKDVTVSVDDSYSSFNHIMWSVAQLSGLAYRKEYLEDGFGDEIFTAHIYPFLSIFKKHKCVFLKDYTVAVQIQTSQSRSHSEIYDIPPTESWMKMYKKVLAEQDIPKKWGMSHMAKNYIGLLQIKNYSRYSYVFREIGLLLKYRPVNILSPLFWIYSLVTILIPAVLLKHIVDIYKRKINVHIVPKIEFEKP